MGTRYRLHANDQLGEWTVIDPDRRIQFNNGVTVAAALVRCSCSTPEHPVEKVVNVYTLASGRSKSCGHLRRQVTRYQARARGRGLKQHPKYGTWCSIKQRCYNPNNPSFKWYGGRGVGLCPEWRDDPAAFLSYIEQLPSYGEPGRSLDRIDNDRGYEPGNLAWKSQPDQVRNSRNNQHACPSCGHTWNDLAA